ncbi:MAG: hypothetical protein JXB30_18215 [Anaerolineae bacterium]|nr:hypothetical protein [Anaerolineae bacterium]
MDGEAPTVDAQRVQQLDRIGGLVTAALHRPDGTVLAAEGSTLLRLDMSVRPAHELGRTDLGHGSILALAESASYQLALTGDGLVVLSGSDALPNPAGFTPGGGQALAVQGDLVVIAARDVGLRVLRTHSEGTAEPLATLPVPGGALDVTLSQDRRVAYVAGGPFGIHQVDLSDPAAPRLAQTIDAVKPADAVALAGSLLVVGSRGRTLLVDPASAGQPVVGRHAPLRDGRRIFIRDEFAYVADAADGLKILWLAAPDRLVQLYGEADRPAYDLWIEEDVVYVVGEDGLRIFDVGSRYRPLEMAVLLIRAPSGDPVVPQGIAVADGRAFIALGDEGVGIVDVSNQAVPRLAGLIALEGPANALLYHDGYLYVACGKAGLAIIDATSETPVEMFPLPGEALDIARRGDALHVAVGEAGLVSVDVVHPDTPIIKGTLPPQAGKSVLSVSISGKRAFLSEGDDFLVADVSRPDHLGRLARVETPAQYVIANDATFYALSGNQITIFDAGATAEPVYLRSYAGLSQVGRISVWRNYAFLTSADEGPDAVVLNLLAPDHPYETDSVGQTGRTYHVLASSGNVYLAAGFGGLRAYELSEGGALMPRGMYNALPEAAYLAGDNTRLLAGGRMGWSVVDQDVSGNLPVRDMALDGNTVAVAAGDAGVALYTLAGSSAPRLLAQCETPDPAVGVALDDRFVYVAGSGGLSIYDRSYLSSIRRVSTPAPATDVALRNGLAYLPLADGSLAVVEVGDPFGGIRSAGSVDMRYPADLFFGLDGHTVYALAGTTLNKLSFDSRDRLYIDETGALPEVSGQGMFLQEGILAALMPGQTFRLINVSELETQTSIYNTMETAAEDIALNWPVAYAAYGEQGVGLIDVRGFASGAVFHQETVRSLHIREDVLFTLGETLAAWDISRPAQPELLDTLLLAASGRHIDVVCYEKNMDCQGDLLLSLESGMTIAHWDGQSLAEKTTLFTPGAIDQAVWSGERAYLALHDGGLLVVDLSDLSDPVRLFTYTSPSGRFVNDLLPLSDTRLLVSWEGGIDVLEVGVVAQNTPRLLTVVPSSGSQALDVAFSPDGSRAAVALGEGGVALFSLADPRSPQMSGYADTPGDGLAVALDGAALYVADGQCGLRVFDASSPAGMAETGYWRGSYAGDLLFRSDSSGQPILMLAGANQIVTLRYDAAMPPVLPPVPQSPDPPNGQTELPLSLALSWGPPTDPCDPLTYDAYFGQGDNPAYLAQVSGIPFLEIPELTPLRTYSWRIETIDRQGDRAVGPLWRFTTVATEFADTLPPAPPTFLAWFEDHPLISVGVSGLLIAALLFLFLRRLRPGLKPLPDVLPEWYSTEEDIEEEDS